jgi:DNA-binding XRE family transcriptional regulator
LEKKKIRNTQWEILKLRVDNNMNHSDMADLMGISKYTYGSKERGLHPFLANEVHIICEHFGVKFEDIFLPTNRNLIAKDKELSE